MESSTIFLLLRFLAQQLPTLIVLLPAIIIIFNRAAPGKLRNTVITGLVILLVELFFRLLLSALHLFLLERGGSTELIKWQSVISGLHLMLSLLHALGLGLLIWTLLRTLAKKSSGPSDMR